MAIALTVTVMCCGVGGCSKSKQDELKGSHEEQIKTELKGEETMQRLRVQGQNIVDELGNQVILYGINMVCKDKSKGYIAGYNREDFEKLRAWGFNVIRLGIIWDGLEPEPEQYNETYLEALEEVIQLAAEYGIYVYLDMHQDLYSSQYSDGAPAWATLTDGNPHTATGLWSESYLVSEAVKSAFTNFWENKQIEGKGLQDYYCNALQYAAKRLSGYENVIGFDLMNEPAPGKITDQIMGTLMLAYRDLVLKDESMSPEEVMQLWLGEASNAEVMKSIQDMSIYKPLIQAVEGVLQEFDQQYLMPFYNKAAKALYEVAPESIMCFESSYFSNMGMMSGVDRLADDIPCIYAPHAYDLVVDTDNYTDYNFERVEFIFETHKKVQDKLNVPTIIGEWGAFYGMQNSSEMVKHIVGILEDYKWSSTYWDYWRGIESSSVLEGLIRAYPQRIGGELESYQYDYENQSFKCTYQPNGEGTLVIYYPYLAELAEDKISASTEVKIERVSIPNEASGYIIIQPQDLTKEVTISINQ